MRYGKVPGIEKPISRLVQGAIMLRSEDEAENFALLDAVFEAGCTTFDTAHVYGGGECERVFGRWVNHRGLRDQVVVLGKGAHHIPERKRVTPEDITADLSESLERLGTDYIDLYLLHRDDPSVPVGPIVEALDAHRKAGRIHAYGGSNWSAERIAEANYYAEAHGLTPFSASSPHLSLAEQLEAPWEDCISITGAANAGQRAWYQEHQFPLFCWSSLAGGWFSGRLSRANQAAHADELYVRCYASEDNWQRVERCGHLASVKGCAIAQVALAWVLHQPYDVFPLIAAYTPEEFQSCAGALAIPLSDEECAWLNLER